jgi:hypothetical protein
MAMSEAFRNYMLDGGDGADIITHIGLVIVAGTEISGGDPAYARKAVTWAAASGGIRRPTADLTFDIPASTTVAGWRGFTAATDGTNYGGKEVTQETFAGQGQYKLLAASTGINAQDQA